MVHVWYLYILKICCLSWAVKAVIDKVCKLIIQLFGHISNIFFYKAIAGAKNKAVVFRI